MRICPFNGCGEKLQDSVFCCRKHWYSLTQSEKNTIHAAWADYRDDKISIERLREVQQGVLGKRGTA